MHIREEIGLFQSKGNIILQGDLNAHTNNKDDVIITDEFDGDFGIEIPAAQHRNSEDSSKTDRRGEEFLELCKALNMIIINGRKTGDPFGKSTSYQWNGKAVVDYVVSSFELFRNITFFKVGKYFPFVSDHCPLFFEVHSKCHPKEKHEDNLKESPHIFYLKSQDKKKLIQILKSPEVADRLTALNGTIGAVPQKLVS